MEDLNELLKSERESIVQTAEDELLRGPVRHYRSAGPEEVKRRLEALYDRLADAIAARDLVGITVYGQDVAEQRYAAGFDLVEVQAGFNALEEALWSRILVELEPDQLAEALGLVTTALGAGKDALARRYVSLAANTHAPSLDQRALFAGTE